MNNHILKGIGFENFRIFKQQTLLDFAKLTVLTGTNSSGKSSVINGLKLIRESFKDVKVSNKPEEFELDSLFVVSFNASEMMKRYGRLDKYISHESRDAGNNSFTFCIPAQLKKIGQKVIISYTIQVEDNELKNGRTTAIEMKLKANGRSLLNIERGSDNYIIKTDLSFFYAAYMEDMEIRGNFFWGLHQLSVAKKQASLSVDDLSRLQLEVEDLHKKYMQVVANYKYDFIDEVEGFQLPSDEHEEFNKLFDKSARLMKGKFYDFSFLWTENPADEKLFEYAMKKFYGGYNKDSLKRLCEDIVNTLSSHQWETERIAHIVYFKDKYSKDNIGLSLIDFALRYFKKGGGRNVPGTGRGLVSFGKTKSGFENLIWNDIEKLENKKAFVEYLFILIANKESYYDRGLFSKPLKALLTPQERILTDIVVRLKSGKKGLYSFVTKEYNHKIIVSNPGEVPPPFFMLQKQRGRCMFSSMLYKCL